MPSTTPTLHHAYPLPWQVRFLDMVAQRQGRGSIARKRSLIERFLGAYVDRDGGQAWELLRLLLPHVRTLAWGWGPAGAGRG